MNSDHKAYKIGKSLPQKLHDRQLYGGKKIYGVLEPMRFFEKCPDNFQIPLKRILDYDIFKKGHVSIGFSADGKYLISYQCQIQFQIDSEPVFYKYSLHWWLFDLWQPLKKVWEVCLFGDESIHYELHILFCQPPDCNYVVVHGSTCSVDVLSSGKMSYVSVVPTVETAMLSHCLHLRYELLPPHPPFITSVCLKLKNVILLNSGDMLFAILLNDKKLFDSKKLPVKNDPVNVTPPSCCCMRRNSEKQKEAIETPATSLQDCGSMSLENDEIVSGLCVNQSQPCTDAHVEQSAMNIETQDLDTSLDCSNCSFGSDIMDESGEKPRCSEYVSFIVQGFSIPDETETQESLPSSPFDCTATVMPCSISSTDGSNMLKHTYEHRCFRKRDKGDYLVCDHFISQAQFDAENFVNEEIQLDEAVNRRFVSVRDYDMQIVEVCQENNEVIILINALIVLRDKVQRNTDPNKSSQKRENYSKLVLYTLGFIVSWNVYSGHVQTLRKYPLVEGPGNICKSRQFAPSLPQTVQIRKKYFVPAAKSSSVQTLSNHTVFSGRSLQYLFNPQLPVAVIR